MLKVERVAACFCVVGVETAEIRVFKIREQFSFRRCRVLLKFSIVSVGG